MFKKKDVVPLLTLVLLIFIIILTLSQILVIHHKSRRNNKSPDMSNLQKELRKIEKTIEMMLETDVVPPEQYQEVLKGSIYASRIEEIIRESIHSRPVHKQKFVNVNKPKHLIYTDMDDRKSRSLHYFLSNLKNNVQRKNDLCLGSLGVSQYTTNSVNCENSSLSSKEDLHTNTSVQLCPETPKLVGKLPVAAKQIISVHDVIFENKDILPGGKYQPRDCIARHRVAVIIPFRNRYQHLVILLRFLLPVLKRQQLDFRIFVVEQYGNDTFNKGRVMNAGFKEAWKLEDFRCFVFHDVDLIPEDDRNMYSCPVYPRHMSVAINEMSYKLLYDMLVGGVLSMRTEHFQMVNGYSNMYWGWGAEDDDMAHRILKVGLKITRPPTNIARYTMIRHMKREPTSVRMRQYLLKTVRKRFHRDGLNSVRYRVVSMCNEPLYTHIVVDIGKPPPNLQISRSVFLQYLLRVLWQALLTLTPFQKHLSTQGRSKIMKLIALKVQSQM